MSNSVLWYNPALHAFWPIELKGISTFWFRMNKHFERVPDSSELENCIWGQLTFMTHRSSSIKGIFGWFQLILFLPFPHQPPPLALWFMQEHKENKEPWMSHLTENSKSGYDGISIMIGRIFKPTRCAASCIGHCLDLKLVWERPQCIVKKIGRKTGMVDVGIVQQYSP